MRYQYWIVNVNPGRPMGYSFCVKVDSSMGVLDVYYLLEDSGLLENKSDWFDFASIYNEDKKYYTDGPDEYARMWMKDAIELPKEPEPLEKEEPTGIPLW